MTSNPANRARILVWPAVCMFTHRFAVSAGTLCPRLHYCTSGGWPAARHPYLISDLRDLSGRVYRAPALVNSATSWDGSRAGGSRSCPHTTACQLVVNWWRRQGRYLVKCFCVELSEKVWLLWISISKEENLALSSGHDWKGINLLYFCCGWVCSNG